MVLSVGCSLCSFICVGVSFLNLDMVFFPIVEDLVYAIVLGFFALIYDYNLKGFFFHGVSQFLYVPFLIFS